MPLARCSRIAPRAAPARKNRSVPIKFIPISSEPHLIRCFRCYLQILGDDTQFTQPQEGNYLGFQFLDAKPEAIAKHLYGENWAGRRRELEKFLCENLGSLPKHLENLGLDQAKALEYIDMVLLGMSGRNTRLLYLWGDEKPPDKDVALVFNGMLAMSRTDSPPAIRVIQY